MEGEPALCTDSDPTSTMKLRGVDSIKRGLQLKQYLIVC